MDYALPHIDSDLYEFTRSLIDLCLIHKIDWAVPTKAIDSLQSLLTAYESALRATQPATRKSDVVIKVEIKEALLRSLKDFINEHLAINTEAHQLLWPKSSL